MFIKQIYNKLISKLIEENDVSVTTKENQRLLLVIKARWFLIALLLTYGLLSASTYLYAYIVEADWTNTKLFDEAINLMIYPGVIVLLVIIYNAIYHISWYKFPHIWSRFVKTFIFAQLAADIPIVLLLIHFTGGINSWFWTLFLVINLELTYLLTINWQILAIGITTGIGYSVLSALEHYGVLKIHSLPFITPALDSSTYLVLMLVWVNLICGFSCLVSIYLHRNEHDELKERITKDALTNLYNRGYFNHRLSSEMQRSGRYNRVFSIILFDLDNFKKYNDTYGHVQGDALLRWVADIFQLNLRRSDKYEVDVACRYGGEEFVIILPETDTEKAVALANRVRETVEKSRFTFTKGTTISAGVASFPKDGGNEKELTEAADRALYAAKRTGKNKVLTAQKEEKLAQDVS